jgi:hypothetical protein
MTVDLADVHIEYLIMRRNKSELIEHLRSDGKVTREFKTLIADILEGRKTARSKRVRITDVLSETLVRLVRKRYQTILDVDAWSKEMTKDKTKDKTKEWDALTRDLKAAGYKGGTKTKGERAAAVIFLTCLRFRPLNPAQLDGIMRRRALRKKSVKKRA